MKARIGSILILLVAMLTLQMRPAQASLAPIFAVDSYFAELNAGNHETAVAAFSSDALATLARGETYRGRNEIRRMVELMEHPGRHYELVQARMVGDTVTVVVEVSDHGIRWGEETIVATARHGKLHTFHEQHFRLRLGS